mgnify:CR=1 FL=1
MKNYLVGLIFICCSLFMAYQQTKILKLEHEKHVQNLLNLLSSNDSVVSECVRCGQIQTIYLYKFKEK